MLSDNILSDGLPGYIHKLGNVGQGNGLPTILAGTDSCGDLAGDVAGGEEPVRLLNQSACNHGAVLEHVIQIHEVAVVHVLEIVVHVVEVDDAIIMGLFDVFRQQHPPGDILGHLPCHIVPLGTDESSVLIGVFRTGLLIFAFHEGQNLPIQLVVTHHVVSIPVGDVMPGHSRCLRECGNSSHDGVLHHILDFLHRQNVLCRLTSAYDGIVDVVNLFRRQSVPVFHALIGLVDSRQDFLGREVLLLPVSLDYFHVVSP